MKRALHYLKWALCVWLAILSGCAHNNYLVHFRSKERFRPQVGSELIMELKKSLPSHVTLEQFFFNKREDEMRGTVVVEGENAREAVQMAIRANSMLAGVITEKAGAGGKFVVCFSSCLPFDPSDEDELFAKLKQRLNSSICPKLVKSRRSSDGMVAWVIVNGNLGKTAVKFAVRQNPNLSLLQVERCNFATRVGLWLHRVKESSRSE